MVLHVDIFNQLVHVCTLEEESLDFADGGIFETGYVQQASSQAGKAMGRAAISTLADRHLARIVAMIFQPSLIYLAHFSPSGNLSFPRAWRSTGLAVRQPFSFLSLALHRLLRYYFRSFGRATDGERGRKELRLCTIDVSLL